MRHTRGTRTTASAMGFPKQEKISTRLITFTYFGYPLCSSANAAVWRGHDPDKTEPPSERFWPFPAGRLTASRPDFHHLGGHNPITSQRAFNAAFARFAIMRIALAHWRETIRAAAPDPKLGGEYRSESTDGPKSRLAPISKSRHDSSDLCITTSPASRPLLARQLCDMLAPLLEIS
ncbi:MAG: hypothetical protein ACOYJ6_20490, partial [Caulobacterales bacterium]